MCEGSNAHFFPFPAHSYCRELLDDSDFHTALERVQREPVPHFTQFSSPTHPPLPTDTPQTDKDLMATHVHHSSSSNTHSISQAATETVEGEVEELIAQDRAMASVLGPGPGEDRATVMMEEGKRESGDLNDR